MMKQEDLFKKVGLILNELNDQYQFLAQNPQQLNELELELFHANANFLADHVQIIKKINATQPPPMILEAPAEDQFPAAQPLVLENLLQEQSQLEEITFANVTEQDDETSAVAEEFFIEEKRPSEERTFFSPERTERTPHFDEIEQEVFKIDDEPSTFEFILNDHAEHEKFEFEEKPVDELFNRPLSDEEEQILAQKKKLHDQLNNEDITYTEEDEIGPEPFLVKVEEEFPIAAEDLRLEVAPVENIVVNSTEPVEDPTYKLTLNDLLAKTNGKNVNTTTSESISDLKQAINLNDKLLYIKDLFNGYNLAYAEAIDIANKLPNFEAADNFFQKNYAAKNNWAEKQATVDRFYQLLNQRFK